MNEALILEKLDKLTDEVASLKSDVLQELKQDLEPVLKQAHPHLMNFCQELEGDYSNEKLLHMIRTLLTSLDELTTVITAVKAGVELTDDMMPVVQQAYPHAIQFFAELDGEFHLEELTALLRKALTNLDKMEDGIDMLRAGIELRDELVPILQLAYPQLIGFFNKLDQAGFRGESLLELLHTVMLNITTLNELLGMAKPVTELVKELESLLKGTDLLQTVNNKLDDVQQGRGLVKLAASMVGFAKRHNINQAQIDGICTVIDNLDLRQAKPVGPLGMIRQVNDPKVQEAFGFLFMMLQAVGSCLQAYQKGD